MDSTVSDDDIRAARDSWLRVRPLGEREGPEYAFYLNLVQAQSRQLAATFRAVIAGRAGQPGRPGTAGRAGGAGHGEDRDRAGQSDSASPA